MRQEELFHNFLSRYAKDEFPIAQTAATEEIPGKVEDLIVVRQEPREVANVWYCASRPEHSHQQGSPSEPQILEGAAQHTGVHKRHLEEEVSTFRVITAQITGFRQGGGPGPTASRTGWFGFSGFGASSCPVSVTVGGPAAGPAVVSLSGSEILLRPLSSVEHGSRRLARPQHFAVIWVLSGLPALFLKTLLVLVFLQE
ncbi:uncharacterized protein GJ701_016861 isoform 1-T1 [Geothlypis trichas]